MSHRNASGSQDDEHYNEIHNSLELLVRATENLLEERHKEQADLTYPH